MYSAIGSLVEVLPQRVELAVPVAGQRGQELLGHLHRRGTQSVEHPAPLTLLGSHQPGLGQQGQVLGDRLPRDRQPTGQVRRRGRTVGGQRGQDGAPGRVGQGDEDLLKSTEAEYHKQAIERFGEFFPEGVHDPENYQVNLYMGDIYKSEEGGPGLEIFRETQAEAS